MKRRQILKGMLAGLFATAVGVPMVKAAEVSEPKKLLSYPLDEFRAFFRKVNGFDMNDNQVYCYHAMSNPFSRNAKYTCFRRVGLSTLSCTMALFYASKEYKVCYISDIHAHTIQTKRKVNTADIKGCENIRYATIGRRGITRRFDKFRGYQYDIILADHTWFGSFTNKQLSVLIPTGAAIKQFLTVEPVLPI